MKTHAPSFPVAFGTTLITALLLLIPLVLMLVTDRVNWGVMDFVLAGSLLMGAGIAFGVLTGKSGSPAFRAIVAGAILAVVCVVWAEVGIGIFNILGD